jgi:hypothetical protein
MFFANVSLLHFLERVIGILEFGFIFSRERLSEGFF